MLSEFCVAIGPSSYFRLPRKLMVWRGSGCPWPPLTVTHFAERLKGAFGLSTLTDRTPMSPSRHSLRKRGVRATSAFPLIAIEDRTSRDVSKVHQKRTFSRP